MGDGYVRQSSADIIAGNTVEAGPLNAEFNQVQSAFHASSGHTHDGTVGEGPKLNLATSTTGILAVAQGGFAGIHKVNGTTAPTANDDTGSGYVVGSHWIDTTNDRVYICVDNTSTAAVWVYVGNTTGWQPLDATLTALAGVTVAANKLIYATGADAFTTTDLTAAGRALLDDATASDQLTTLGVSTFAKTLLDDANAAAILSTLGVTASVTELNYVAGVTSAIQTQLNGKAATSHTHTLSDVTDSGALAALNTIDTTHITASALVTEVEGITLNDNDTTLPTSAAVKDYVDAAVAAGSVADGDKGDIVVSGSGAIWNIDTGVIVDADVNAAAAIAATKIGNGDVDNTELSYLNGVTSAIQTQLDAKLTASSTATLTNKTFDANGTGNALSNVEVADFAAAAIVTEAEGLASSDNDTSIPTTAAVVDYVASAGGGWDVTGQSWQDVSASRALGTSYQNSTGKPIQVFITMGTNNTSERDIEVQVSTNGSTWVSLTGSRPVVLGTDIDFLPISFIVPDTHYYRAINNANSVILEWVELR